MSQIVWLASYPKSGNTWLRAFLTNFLLDRDGAVPIDELGRFVLGDMDAWPYERVLGGSVAGRPVEDIYTARPQAHRLLAAQRDGTVLVKTHVRLTRFDDIPTITPDVTAGAVYVVRNPLDVVISYADHYGTTIDQAIEASGIEHHFAGGHGSVIPQYLGTWSSHVRSWTRAQGLYRLVVRYEDMQADPVRTFGTVVDFLKLARERTRLKRAIKHASFKELAGQERRTGFGEKGERSERFFRKGVAGGWRAVLTEAQIARVTALHGEVMGEFGYLDADGRAVA